ncbi:hypothetical protein ABXK20_002054 [Serratia marcescens]|nr:MULTISPECIES: hypothetical protein [Serratia]
MVKIEDKKGKGIPIFLLVNTNLLKLKVKMKPLIQKNDVNNILAKNKM